MSVNLEMKIALTAKEKFSSSSELVTVREWDHRLNFSKALTGSSSVPVTKAYSDRFSLSSGSATLDLTSLTDAKGDALDLTGLKVQLIAVQCASGNTDAVTVDVGTSNGYEFGGDSTSEMSVQQGGTLVFYAPETLDDVGASDKTIDFSSSDEDASVDVLIVAG